MKYQIHYKPSSALGWRGDRAVVCMEYNYTFDLIKELSKHLNDEWKLILTGEQALPDFEGHDPNKIIVLQISDEHGKVPEFHKDVRAVFKHYSKPDCEAGNVYPLPLGENTGILPLPYRKVENRSIDVFFSGNPHEQRKGILEGLQKKLEGKCNFVFFENNVLTMDAPLYSHYMMDSKISLSFAGGISPQSYRWFEGLSFGCTTLGPTGLPDNWIYRNNPTIIPDWNNLDKVADGILKLLGDEKTLEGTCRESADFYEKRYNPHYVVTDHILPYLK